MSEKVIQPEPPDEMTEDLRKFWRGMGRTMVRNSISTIDAAAKQIIGVAGILEGLYFHAVAYGDLRGQVSGWPMIVYLLPVVLLLVSLAAALAVFLPDHYRVNLGGWEACQLVHKRVVRSKLGLLRVASAFLALGVAAVLLTITLYLQG